MSWRFVACAAVFVTCLLTANTIAAKLIVVSGVLTPLTYAAVAWLKAREGVDTDDYDTVFNPVRL